MSSGADLRRVLKRTPGKLGRIAGALVLIAAWLTVSVKLQAVPPATATDPGVRGGAAGAGAAVGGLTTSQLTVFSDGKTSFTTAKTVPTGLGPRFNSNQCSSCHTQPA